ncbi:hypothetical protein JA1_000968 [Spathaspora sp. JA1]|nr:hypothetical protein JA1_000968 [Spathaspora sp. JA1]
MNFDRLNPLSNYFSKAGAPEISDWGIEESSTTGPNVAVSSPTMSHEFYNSHPHPPHPSYLKDRRPSVLSSSSSWTYYHQNQQQQLEPEPQPQPQDFTYYYQKYCNQTIPPTTENFSKFIRKYLSMEAKVDEFWEKFKYNLILSNLLQDSMILSKNEQSLMILNKTISQQQQQQQTNPFVYMLNPDDSRLFISDKQYKLMFNSTYNNSKLILLIINSIIYLLKQGPGLNPQNRLKMFKIILIISTKIIKIKKFTMLIQMNQILNLVNDFLISNYTINKKIILQMINLKELHTFTFLSSQDTSTSDSSQLHAHLLNSLGFLNLNFKSLISELLLPGLNGELLQQYCNINTIDLEMLTREFTPSNNNDEYIDEIRFNITKFNQLRKLFICQLLAIQTPTRYNFFLHKLMEQFNTNPQQSVQESNRLGIIKRVLVNHNQTCKNIISLFEKFEKTTTTITHENEDILRIHKPQPNLQSLISKLSSLTENLQYFEKYQSTEQDKLGIFQQFQSDLKSINQLYSVVTDDLSKRNQDIIPNSPRESLSSNSSETFNLKTFHTRSSRYSTIIDDKLNSSSETKRSSAGLQVGLVTVVEESPITTFSSLDNERYHQITLDQLSSNKRSNGLMKTPSMLQQNRFSLNSVKSNVSGLTELINTQITSPTEDDEEQQPDEPKGYSKEALRLKLEESFNRIYNLENENKFLKENSADHM